MFSLQHSEFLLGFSILSLIVLAYKYNISWKRKVKTTLGSTSLIESFIQDYSSKLFLLKFFLILLALSFIIISVANPRKESKNNQKQSSGSDIIIAIDASNSMLATDISPSRLDASKEIANNLMKNLSNNRIGVIAFGGKPFLQLPVTADIEAVKISIDGISTDAVPEQGTAIGEALALCTSSLILPDIRPKAIILISDGENHDHITLEQTGQLNKKGISLLIIGIGTNNGIRIVDTEKEGYKKDESGKDIISKLNETTLKNLANISKGKYFRYDDLKSDTKPLLTDINNNEDEINSKSTDSVFASYYWLFLLMAIVLLILEVFIPEVKRRNLSVV